MSLYTIEKKVCLAAFPRTENSTIFDDDRLSICYNKFKTTNSEKLLQKGILKINLIFSHGTGMNKSIWDYHVEKLYQYFDVHAGDNWILDCVICADTVNHGDSAIYNEDLLGWVYDWRDGSKDTIEIIKFELETTTDFQLSENVKNIIIGHSMGGFQALYAGFLEPLFIDAIVSVEPVIYTSPESAVKFRKLIPALKRAIRDEFKTKKEYVAFFKKFSFYKNFKDEILEHFIEDEASNNADQTGPIKLKTSKSQQLITYTSNDICLNIGMAVLPFLSQPVLHIIGTGANWNPLDSADFIRSLIPKVKRVDIPGGQHLLNCEQPDVLLEHVERFIEARASNATAKRKGNRKEIFDLKYNELMDSFGPVKTKL